MKEETERFVRFVVCQRCGNIGREGSQCECSSINDNQLIEFITNRAFERAAAMVFGDRQEEESVSQ